MFKIDHSSARASGIIGHMAKRLTQRQLLAIRCPTCGAAPREGCELSTGFPRFEQHEYRRLTAWDARGRSAASQGRERVPNVVDAVRGSI